MQLPVEDEELLDVVGLLDVLLEFRQFRDVGPSGGGADSASRRVPAAHASCSSARLAHVHLGDPAPCSREG